MTGDMPSSRGTSNKTAAAVFRLARICCVIAALAIAVGEVAGSHWPVVCVTPFLPQWTFLAGLGLALLWPRLILRRFSRLDAACALVAFPALVFGVAVIVDLVPWRNVRPAERATADAANFGAIKIVSANVHVTNTDHASLLKLIDDERPDVIYLCEVNDAWMADLKPLRATYPYRTNMPDELGAFGAAVFSRLPADVRWTTFADKLAPGYETPQADATVTLAGPDGLPRSVRVIGLHPLPPIKAGNTVARDAVLDGVRKGVIDRLETPTIVCGDLNATRYCDIVGRLTAQAALADATSSIRWSWPNKWSWPAMGIRIDHILVSRHWRVADVHVGRDIGSDHRPLVATLQRVDQ